MKKKRGYVTYDLFINDLTAKFQDRRSDYDIKIAIQNRKQHHREEFKKFSDDI